MHRSADYAEHLIRQDAAVQAFVDVLHRERDVLADRPVDYVALSDITDAKARQAEALDALERERGALAEAARAGVDIDDAELAGKLGCSALWVRMSAHAAEARHQNAINGVAIDTRLGHTEARLDFLRRNASESLYAADGQRRPTGTTGRLRGGA